jgi:hypothetical protein
MLAFAAPAPGADWAAVDRFKACFSPIVAENDRRPESEYIRFDDLFAKVKSECAAQRLAARDALSAFVAATVLEQENRQLPSNDAWKEELIDEATIRWMNNVTAENAGRDHD